MYTKSTAKKLSSRVLNNCGIIQLNVNHCDSNTHKATAEICCRHKPTYYLLIAFGTCMLKIIESQPHYACETVERFLETWLPSGYTANCIACVWAHSFRSRPAYSGFSRPEIESIPPLNMSKALNRIHYSRRQNPEYAGRIIFTATL